MSSKIKMSTFKSATSFYDANNITYFTCPLITTHLNSVGVEKKKCPRFPNHKNFSKEDYTRCHEQQATTCVVTGAISNITVIDFDDLAAYKKLINKHQELTNNYIISTNKGVHMYFT